MHLDAEYLVRATQQDRRREAEQYRLAHPQTDDHRDRARRRRTWLHLAGFPSLVHHGRRTPRMLG